MNTPLCETETTRFIPEAAAQERFDDLVNKRKSAQKGGAADAREILYALARRIEADPNGANPHEQYLFAKHGVEIPKPAAWAEALREAAREVLASFDSSDPVIEALAVAMSKLEW